MLYRLRKVATSLAYLLIIWLTWQWFQGDLSWGFSLSCVVVSGLWLVITASELGHLFRTYFDTLSRLKTLVPIAIGVALAFLAVVYGGLELKIAAGVELASWLAVYVLYRLNKRKFMIQGHGPMPKGAWINPPMEALEDDPDCLQLVLTSGNMANRLRETVGHGEVVIKQADGQLYLLSCYMERGCVYHEAKRFAGSLSRRGHYIVLKLTKRLTDEQRAAVPHLVKILLAQNAEYIKEAQASRQKWINWLPLPASAKKWLTKKLPVTGYDWLGLMIGQRHANRWTCIGLCLELYHRLGIKTNNYGTGLLGFGTGLFDPIMPVRFLSDPAFQLLTEADRLAYEKKKAA